MDTNNTMGDQNGNTLQKKLYEKTSFFGLKLWVVLGLAVGLFMLLVLLFLSLWLVYCRRKSKPKLEQIKPFPNQCTMCKHPIREGVNNTSSRRKSSRTLSSNDLDIITTEESPLFLNGGDNGISLRRHCRNCYTLHGSLERTPLMELKAVNNVFEQGWGRWFTWEDLYIATSGFSVDSVLCKRGCGTAIFKGMLNNGAKVSVKCLLNNTPQGEKEFYNELEITGSVRHKNILRLIGICIEETHRMLVYEYMKNGSLEDWLRNPVRNNHFLNWEARMKIILGTAKALSYLHEALVPRVVHRDIRSSNVLIDDEWNAKISEFGVAKILGSAESKITTCVIGTCGYVAPEYAKTGQLNETSDLYSFGVLLLETITGRTPIDYSRPNNEVNLVHWVRVMVGTRRAEEVLDPNLSTHQPEAKSLKKALLVALHCVDPNVAKRPKMSEVVQMLESEEIIFW